MLVSFKILIIYRALKCVLWNPYLIEIVADVVIVRGLKELSSIPSSFPAVEMRNSLLERIHSKILSFQNDKHWYIIQTKLLKAPLWFRHCHLIVLRVKCNYAYSPFKKNIFCRNGTSINQTSVANLRYKYIHIHNLSRNRNSLMVPLIA